jgi:AcrR family transcriptional regulator
MWFAAVDHGFRNLLAELEGAGTTGGDDPLDQIRAAMLRFIEVAAARPALLRIINQEAARPGARYEYMFETYIGPVQQLASDQLKQLQADGRLRPGSIATIYFFLTTHGIGALATHSKMLDRLGDPDATLTDAASTAVDIVLDGLRIAS